MLASARKLGGSTEDAGEDFFFIKQVTYVTGVGCQRLTVFFCVFVTDAERVSE
jgi:hypothetical protein